MTESYRLVVVWQQAKRAGSKLKSRIVAEQSVTKWSQNIDQMEDKVVAVMQEERYSFHQISVCFCTYCPVLC